MKNRTILILVLVTGLIAALAAITSRDSSPSASETGVGQKLFPALLDSINDVSQLSIESAEGKVTLAKTGDAWGLAEKHDYPVDLEMVSSTLRGLALMETIEKKTSSAERYSALGVEGLGEGSSSTQVTLENASATVVANLIIGKHRAGRAGGDEFYVRKDGDSQTWLVSAPLKTNADASAWMDKQIVKIPRTRVQAFSAVHANGETLNLSKQSSEELTFTVHDLPEDRELSYAAVADSAATTLEWLNLEDVVPTAELELGNEWATKTTFWTFEGVRIEVTVTEKDGSHWAQFVASFDADGAEFAQAADTPPIAIEETAAVTEEVATLNKRFSMWTYKLPLHSVTALGKRMSQLLKPLPTEPEEGEGGALPTDDTKIEDLLSPEQLKKLQDEHGFQLPTDDGR